MKTAKKHLLLTKFHPLFALILSAVLILLISTYGQAYVVTHYLFVVILFGIEISLLAIQLTLTYFSVSRQ
jgi:NADH:ubiquinone oxidoreductase subunit K